MNTRFVLRGFTFALIVIGLIAAAFVVVMSRFLAGPPSGPPPPPATILAPRGEIPSVPVGMSEWAKYQNEEYGLAGSGFFLGLDSGGIVAATTAHSLSLGNSNRPIEQIAFGIAGQDGFMLEMDVLHGDPGVPRWGSDMTVDFVLLRVDGFVDPNYILQPDSRGEPQPGERVVLYSGIGHEEGGIRILYGTVHTVDRNGAWVLMDDDFQPGLMSGSPFVSEHTGNVVGMAISAGQSEFGLMIGMHPIGSLVSKAQDAANFPLLIDYGR